MADFEALGNTRVLIVDDQEEIHEDFAGMLKGGDTLSSDELADAFLASVKPARPAFHLLHASSGEEGCEIVSTAGERGEPVAVAYVDVRMPPGIDGVEAVRRMRAVDRDVEIVIMTAYSDKPLSDIVDDMELLHKLLYIRKPFAREEIQQVTLSLVVKWNVEREVAAGRRRLADSHRRLEAVLDAAGDAMAMYDRGGRLVFANAWYEQLFDLPPGGLRAMPREAAMARFMERSPGRAGPASNRAGMTPGNGSVVEPQASGADRARGKPLLHRSTQPVRDAEGAVVGELIVFRDVSKELEIERMKLEAQQLRAEVATLKRTVRKHDDRESLQTTLSRGE